jgi:hypothetical protein
VNSKTTKQILRLDEFVRRARSYGDRAGKAGNIHRCRRAALLETVAERRLEAIAFGLVTPYNDFG